MCSCGYEHGTARRRLWRSLWTWTWRERGREWLELEGSFKSANTCEETYKCLELENETRQTAR
jgi:hypothetical protein